MKLFGKRFGQKTQATPTEQLGIPVERLMTSQFPALYLKENDASFRDYYIKKLMSIGFNEANAKKMFAFECEIIRKYPKQYLLHPDFTTLWFITLRQPFFMEYPKTKEDILKEKFLTMSEICKLIDEAQWHFWHSHEKDMPDEVWAEIYAWRLRWTGAEFATTYFEMIEKETGVPLENINALCKLQAEHLNKYKW